ncbi:hypothetical protein BGZ83_008544 [Gryganskiella cystojenkinii]|nr:hypothetical protein BGZ83_008544 [Gryganskiella cystojenkinii]
MIRNEDDDKEEDEEEMDMEDVESVDEEKRDRVGVAGTSDLVGTGEQMVDDGDEVEDVVGEEEKSAGGMVVVVVVAVAVFSNEMPNDEGERMG